MNAAYYNEHDDFAASWLEELIKARVIMDGVVDRRSIEDVLPSELDGFTRCHFFAGIGGWDYALHLAGWPDDAPIWTGSCPCQPFSAAGEGGGFADERHLWPSWFWLLQQCRPPVVMGEQVEAAIRHGWLDLVQDDLEGEGYAVGAIGLPAASVGAPHIRQRLWFVADTEDQRHERRGSTRGRGVGSSDDRSIGNMANPLFAGRPERGTVAGDRPTSGSCCVGGMENPGGQREHALVRGHETSSGRQSGHPPETRGGSTTGRVAHPDGRESSDPRVRRSWRQLQLPADPLADLWANADWIPCQDGKWRPVESGTFPLAHGVPARLGRLRGYGNAINPVVAADVIKAYMSVRGI